VRLDSLSASITVLILHVVLVIVLARWDSLCARRGIVWDQF
jgi:hypothetical protein